MKNFFQEYFYYTRQERNGALGLILLCTLFVLAPRLYPFFKPATKISAEDSLREAAEKLALSEDLASGGPHEETGTVLSENFYFDPNTADKETFIRLGLSERTAQTILNYRTKGGRFFKKEDFKKIYALRDVDYKRLAPFIRIGGDRENERNQTTRPNEANEPAAALFEFDPNSANDTTLRKLALSEKVVQIILNYRSKGGQFRKKEDLAKIYSLPATDYQRLEPYIRIESRETGQKNAPDPKTSDPVVLIDINKASVEAWQQLRGIGPAIAGRIVSYREKLGGFSSIQQIGETRGLPDSTFQQIKSQLQVSPVFRPLFINTASIDEFSAHPYLSKREAEAIAAYRANHGTFRTFEEVKKVKALTPGVLEKIKPYLQY